MVEAISEGVDKNVVIFVLGTTAVGKSKLALDLALSVGDILQSPNVKGEIVNADSM